MVNIHIQKKLQYYYLHLPKKKIIYIILNNHLDSLESL
jgi:hypothetical protein